MTDRRCIWCVFAEVDNGWIICRRYPQFNRVYRDDWCGEYVEWSSEYARRAREAEFNKVHEDWRKEMEAIDKAEETFWDRLKRKWRED